MTSSRDAADLTDSLLEWTRRLFPDATIVPAPSAIPREPPKTPPADKRITLALSGLRSFNGDRRGDALSRRVQLDYAFDVEFADPLDQHQAVVDLAFALLDRDDVADASTVVSTGSVVSVSFELVRRQELARAKPVRSAKFDLRPNVPIKGMVQAESGFPLARARLQLESDDRLIIADDQGKFAFNAAEGSVLKAVVSARGKSRKVELQPNKPNIVTLTMES
jgi:hypothetical protein